MKFNYIKMPTYMKSLLNIRSCILKCLVCAWIVILILYPNSAFGSQWASSDTNQTAIYSCQDTSRLIKA